MKKKKPVQKKEAPARGKKKKAAKRKTKSPAGSKAKSVDDLVNQFHKIIRKADISLTLAKVQFQPNDTDNCPCGVEWFQNPDTQKWEKRCAICD